MKNTEINTMRRSFDNVWQRVMPDDNLNDCGCQPDIDFCQPEMDCCKPCQEDLCPSEDYAAMLRDLMDCKAEDIALYCCLIKRLTGCAAETLLKCLRDERRHLKKLQTQYYLLTGELYCPPTACPCVFLVADALRAQYEKELTTHRNHRDMASRTSRSDIADMCNCIADDDAVHARRISCLFESLMRDQYCCN